LPIDDDSPLHHALWNVLGGGAQSALKPEIRRVALEADDVVLLCSDGLTKHVSDAQIAEVIAAGPAAAEACAALVSRANDDGGSDNITVVVAQRQIADRCAAISVEGPTRIRAPRS
jgi:protein phosphatase